MNILGMRVGISVVLLSMIGMGTAIESAQAQAACAEGRERGSSGRCCWPGQTFSTTLGRCDGVPACPSGLLEHGDDCVAPATGGIPSPPVSTEVESSTETASHPPFDAAPADAELPGVLPAPPDSDPTGAVTGYFPFGYETPSTAHPAPRWESLADGPLGSRVRHPVQYVGEDEGLLTASFALYGVGWVMGWMVPILDETNLVCSGGSAWSGVPASCGSWGLTFIPVVGPFLAGITSFGSARFNATYGMAFGIPSMILQTAGLVAIIISLANETTEYRLELLDEASRTHDLSVSLTFDAPNADAGASLLVRF